ncbi:MAG: DMT family transporter [Phycisphaerales bacterium]|nr:DMT family transporter [Phycisphaerales bacterium]
MRQRAPQTVTGDDSNSENLRTRNGTILLLIAATLWSLNGGLIKLLEAAGLGAGSIASFRSLVAAIFLLPFAWPRFKRLEEPIWIFATVLMFTGMCGTFVLATTATSAANAIILQYTAPAWVFVLSPWIVKERANPKQSIALAVSMAAVGLIFLAQYETDLFGMLIGLLSGMVFGTQVVLFRRVRAIDPIVLAFLCCAGSGVLLLPVALLLEPIQLTVSIGGWLILTGVVQFGFPYVIYAAGVRHVSAQLAILIIMLEPVLNPVWTYLFHREVPHWSTMVGGAVILCSVAYLSLSRENSSVSG